MKPAHYLIFGDVYIYDSLNENMNPNQNKFTMNKPKKVQIKKKSTTPLNKEETKSRQSEQTSSKKNTKQNKKSFYLNSYMEEIIKEVKEDHIYSCQVCPENPKLVKRSVHRRILESGPHRIWVASRLSEHEELVKLINGKRRNDKKKDQTLEDTKTYLEFLAFCLKSNFSFLQISALGKFMKLLTTKSNLSFFCDMVLMTRRYQRWRIFLGKSSLIN